MPKYKVHLSIKEEIKAKDEDEAMKKFLEMIDSMSGGWDEDNTFIEEIE